MQSWLDQWVTGAGAEPTTVRFSALCGKCPVWVLAV
jgi:hypothetical protein